MNVPRGFLHKKSRQASRQRHTTDCEPLVISTAATITIIPDVLRACGIHLRSDNSLSAVVRLLHFFVLTPLPWLAVFPLKTTTIHPYGISVYVHICHIYIYKPHIYVYTVELLVVMRSIKLIICVPRNLQYAKK